jgi:uncharacterized protein YggE
MLFSTRKSRSSDFPFRVLLPGHSYFAGGFMTAHTRLSVFLLVSGLAAGTVSAAGGGPGKSTGRKIVVNASATVQVKPDAARLTFAITTEAPQKVREANDKQVKKLKDSLAALAFRNVEVRVVPQSVTTMTTGPLPGMRGPGGPGFGALPGGQAPAVQSKQVQSLFFVTVREKDLDKLREMVTKLADVAEENGGTAIASDDTYRSPLSRRLASETHGPRIDWLAEHTGEVRREAIRKAVKEAQARAQAAVGDARLEVTEIQVFGAEDSPVPYRLRGDLGPPDSGLVPVAVRVQVTYSY